MARARLDDPPRDGKEPLRRERELAERVGRQRVCARLQHDRVRTEPVERARPHGLEDQPILRIADALRKRDIDRGVPRRGRAAVVQTASAVRVRVSRVHVQGKRQHFRIGGKRLLDRVAVMRVEVDVQDAQSGTAQANDREGGIVEVAEPLCAPPTGVMHAPGGVEGDASGEHLLGRLDARARRGRRDREQAGEVRILEGAEPETLAPRGLHLPERLGRPDCRDVLARVKPLELEIGGLAGGHELARLDRAECTHQIERQRHARDRERMVRPVRRPPQARGHDERRLQSGGDRECGRKLGLVVIAAERIPRRRQRGTPASRCTRERT
jgi:hypothetical protein